MNRTGRSAGATGVRPDDQTRALAEANARSAEMLVRLEELNAELKQAQQALKEVNSELERRVEQRTGELRNSEERFRILFEYAPDAYYLNDMQGRLLDGNRAAEEMVGYRRDELVGQSFLKQGILAVSQVPRAAALLVRNALGQATGPEEFTLNRKDGSQVQVEIMSHPVTLDGKRVSLGTMRDITRRKQADERERQQLREMSQLSQSALELVHSEPEGDIYQAIARQLRRFTGDAIVVLSSTDSDSGTLTIRAVEGVGDRFKFVLKTLGRSPVGMELPYGPGRATRYEVHLERRGTPSELAVGRLSTGVLRAFERILNLDSVYSMGIMYQGKEFGTVTMITRRGTELSNLDAIEAFVHQAAIALQRKLAEDELARYRQHLEELVAERTRELTQAQGELVKREKQATVGQIAASMAHELRNPMGAMHNAVIYLNMAERQSLSEKGLRHLAVIDSQIERSNRIITALLDFAESQPAVPRRVELSGILEHVLTELCIPEGVAVVKEISVGLPPLFVDPEQVGVALRNLIENALMAMTAGGRLTLRASSGESRDGAAPQVQVQVEDTGCGIKSEHLPRLFEPLFSTRAVGVGLGLPIARKLVEANHGSIAVQSEPGKGAVFTVMLPAAEQGMVNCE